MAFNDSFFRNGAYLIDNGVPTYKAITVGRCIEIGHFNDTPLVPYHLPCYRTTLSCISHGERRQLWD